MTCFLIKIWHLSAAAMNPMPNMTTPAVPYNSSILLARSAILNLSAEPFSWRSTANMDKDNTTASHGPTKSKRAIGLLKNLGIILIIAFKKQKALDMIFKNDQEKYNRR